MASVKDKLLPLHDLKNVNTVISMLYDKDGKYRAGFKPGEFYNTILLDTLVYSDENYVHLKFAETITIKKGENTARFRRWAGLTPTLRVLKEGVPPAPDKHAMEILEVSNEFAFGGWSEYTEEINLSVVDEIVSERSHQYGRLASDIKELYARKTWLSSPNEFYANFKTGFKDLAFGDEVLLDDLRFLISRMKRVKVKPIGGKYQYICSPEFINSLIDDPRVKQYMEINNTTGDLWDSGKPFPMFELLFIPTMLDEFAYPDTQYPGVYENSSGEEIIRLYYALNNTFYYLDIHEKFNVKTSQPAKRVVEGASHLDDGTAVEDREYWTIPNDMVELSIDNSTGNAVTTGEATADKVVLRKSIRTAKTDAYGNIRYEFGPLEPVVADDLDAINDAIGNGDFSQLPVHRGILFGDEAMIKINREGVSDNPEFFIQTPGSSGVADPIHQRQSIGFKVKGFGMAIKRPEAIVVTYSIPKHAELAALTSRVISGEYELLDSLQDDTASTYANKVSADGSQDLRVDGINKGGYPNQPYVAGEETFTKFNTSTAYKVGDKVLYNKKTYVFTQAHPAGNWNPAHVEVVSSALENNAYDDDNKSNID